MGYLTRLDILTNIIQSIILIVIIAKTIKLTIETKASLLPFFFALALSGTLLSNFYWFAYDILKPDTRMPMACNEIGENATILLLCAGLDTILKDKRKVASEIVFAIFFIGANIALWILWTGEWFQDILFGIPYIYFFWLLIRGLKSSEILSRKEMWVAAAVGIIILAMQIPLYFTKGEVFNFICFMVMFALTVWLGIVNFRRKDFFLATTFFMWTELAMFLNSDFYYDLFVFASTVAIIIMYSSLKKELAAND
ncbi:MAG: hypothetical protein IKN03_10165 [Fibrobacter sp.]|nr:hypothetical protein [Fibrobacter sp.]